MHVQIVNFRLKGITRAQYEELCDAVAPGLASFARLIPEQVSFTACVSLVSSARLV